MATSVICLHAAPGLLQCFPEQSYAGKGDLQGAWPKGRKSEQQIKVVLEQ